MDVLSCPSCGALTRHPKRKDKRGAINIFEDGRLWSCKEDCGAGGDVINLVSYSLTSKPFRDVDTNGKEQVKEWFVEHWPFIADRTPTRSTPREPTPPRYPPAQELKALWGSSSAVIEDKEARAWLWQRLVPTQGDMEARDALHNQVLEVIASQDLARAIHLNADRPSWLQHTTNRLMFPLCNGMGQFRSCKVRPLPGPKGKGFSPRGFDATGLVFANITAREMLETGRVPNRWPKNEPFRLIVCEGEVDWMTWCVHDELVAGDARETPAPAIIGIFSGSWTDALAGRIPNKTLVIIRNDRDEKGTGEKYARRAFELLDHRCTLRWLGPSDGTEMPDDNDLFLKGELPADPAEGTEIMRAEGEADPLEIAPTMAALYGAKQLEADKNRELISLAQLPSWPVILNEGGRDADRWAGHGWGDALDQMIGGGVEPGEMIGIGASSAGAGKTALVMQLADGLALRSVEIAEGKITCPACPGWGRALTPIVMLSEMHPRQLTRRSLARWLGITHTSFRKFDNETAAAWDAAADTLSGSPLGLSRQWIRVLSLDHWELTKALVDRWTEDLTLAHPDCTVVPVVVIDPIQRCMTGTEPEVEALNRITDQIRDWTTEGQWIVFVTSDTNKASAAGRERQNGGEWGLIEEGAAAFRGSYRLLHALDLALYIKQVPLGADEEPPVDPSGGRYREQKVIPFKARNGALRLPWPGLGFMEE